MKIYRNYFKQSGRWKKALLRKRIQLRSLFINHSICLCKWFEISTFTKWISFHASTFAMKSEAEKCWAHEKSERHAEFACACISIMKNNNNNAQAGFQLIKTCKVRYYSRSFVTNVLQCENVIKFVCATPSICIFIAIPNVYLYIFARWHKTLLIEFDRLDFCLFGIGKDSSARLLSGNQSDWYVRQINQYGNHLAVK